MHPWKQSGELTCPRFNGRMECQEVGRKWEVSLGTTDLEIGMCLYEESAHPGCAAG
ncbi:MAG: hypothetical protein HND48_18170 [Chloroflexi bacterium]|nr:hypothetical protein [Chloroflexota bacterium]